MTGESGTVLPFGDAGFFGDTHSVRLNSPIAGMEATSDGKGYWLVASDGGIFAFGNAGFFGSLGGQPLNLPMQRIRRAPDGQGYWTQGLDGLVHGFGSATFHGDGYTVPTTNRDAAITFTSVGPGTSSVSASLPDNGGGVSNTVQVDWRLPGVGYWMGAADGGIFAFGVPFFGSTGNVHLNQPIVGMASTPEGDGYWLVAADGGVFVFGQAPFRG